ncbi:hypothetical protein FGM00_16070 [Aggregatimonas sangjinii]|uniref:Uncharacterized protein n=1 Tax=Aggregatimonas sangjinii TaxID=2583587 RepID=A0A5B7SW57_9FLAO|nr:hypothetical protein [Aggregatimonas sangjinii]QCX01549.1 hypothetical protein FGM00_16070 [Aggregatimonas sangjinii]
MGSYIIQKVIQLRINGKGLLTFLFIWALIYGCKSVFKYKPLVVYEYSDTDGKTLGDYWIYDKVRYGQYDYLLFFCAYHDTIGVPKRILDAKVRIPKQLDGTFANKSFTVSSTKIGTLDFVSVNSRGEFFEYTFLKGVDSLERLEIMDLVANDTIIFSIGENDYLFKSTQTEEFELD